MSNVRSGSTGAGGEKRGGVKIEASSPIKIEADDGHGPIASGSGGGGGGQAKAKREVSPPLPTTYRDIPLYSSTLDDWSYHLMRLASHARVDPSDPQQFPFPVKLNRKWPPKLKEPLPHAGDPVVDQFGKPVMVPAQRRDPTQAGNQQPLTAAERKRIPLLWPGPDDDVDEVEELLARLETPKGPQADASLIGPSASSNNATRAKAGLFQKRVREIHKASAAARKTHNEEALPWVLEDYETTKEWESRRKESRRGMKALQQGIKVRREGGRFPSLPKEEEGAVDGVKTEDGEGIKAEETKVNVVSSNENHAPWIGKLEGEAHESGSTSAGGAMSHALFIFDERDAGGFRVVPVSRMYKFLQRPKHANKISWEEAEKQHEKYQKAKMSDRNAILTANQQSDPSSNGGGEGFGMLRRPPPPGRGYKSEYGRAAASIYSRLLLPTSAGSGTFSSQPSAATIYNRDSSQRRNQFVAVSGEKNVRVKDEEGTYGEIAFEEDFADDEERNEGDDYAMGEEETRELEQKIKREMARAEEEAKQEEEDEEDDLFDERGRRPGKGENDILTGSGKQMKKIMKALARREGTDLYDEDDEERNPYFSEESDEGEESVMANPEEALRRVREEREREAKEAAKNNGVNSANGESTAHSKAPSKDGSRSGTPGPSKGSTTGSAGNVHAGASTRPGSSSHRPGAGHANVAQRATSPSGGGGNGGGGGHSRSGSRSGSPAREGGSPTSPTSLKRKSEIGGAVSNGGSSSVSNGGKRLRTGTGTTALSGGSQPGSPGSASPRSASPSRGSYRAGGGNASPTPQALNELEREIVQLVRNGKATTTKELIAHFAARLNSKAGDGSIKKAFSDAASRVLITEKPKGTLAVRPGL